MKIQLPIDAYIPDILQKLKASNNLVLTAAPGAGKTTRLPPALLEITNKKILVLEPRRMAAASSSVRIAEENHWQLGNQVGYEVRFEKKVTESTRLIFLTEALLNKKITSDPDLKDIGIVILDEFHERSVHVDLAIGLLKELQELSRPDLKIIVMSATLNAKRISDFLNQAEIIEIPGKLYDLKIEYSKESQLLNLGPDFINRVADAIKNAFNKSKKDILVFLPGTGEINRTIEKISGIPAEVLPLHGNLDLQNQLRALKSSADKRRIILSTNIAESSVTVDGVDFVVDSGLAKILEWDAKSGLESLNIRRISKSSATQRAGRAARQYPGQCLRLWNQMDERSMPENEKAEILRTDLTAVVLTLATIGIRDFKNFTWFESPPAIHLNDAIDYLKHIKALDSENKITEFGKNINLLPLPPRWAALVLQAQKLKLANLAGLIASLLQEKEVLINKPQFDSSDSDLIMRLEFLKEKKNINFATAQRINNSAEQIKKIIHSTNDVFNNKNLEILLLKTFPDRLCRRRRSNEPFALMMGGRGVKLSPQSVVQKAEFFIALEIIDQDKDALVYMATPISKESILEVFNSEIKTESVIRNENEKIQKFNFRSLWGLPLEDGNLIPIKPEDIAGLLPEMATNSFADILKNNEPLNSWYQRYLYLLKIENKKNIFSTENLKNIFKQACFGEKSINDLFHKDLIYFFESQLDPTTKDLLDSQYPEHIVAPTGSKLKINYQSDTPSIEVRLQEVFGWMETPKIANNKIALVIYLLAPNYRPVQITKDLKSFWQSGYFEVKKELKMKYPKHLWPDDPLTAKPEAKGRRRN